MWQNTITCDVGTAQCEDGTIKCEKKIKEPPNMTIVQSHVMLVLYNVRMVPSNMRKKIREPLFVTKVQSHVMLVLHNVMMVPLNVKKNKGTTVCDKSTVTCDVSITQCEDSTIKYDVLVTWYSRLPIRGYRTPQKKEGVM